MRIGLQLSANPEKFTRFLQIIRERVTGEDDLEFCHIPDESVLRDELPGLDALACYRISAESFSRATPRLKWIHFGATGIEHSLFPSLLRSNVTLTNARGIHAGPVSEYILGAMLYFAKRFQDCENFKSTREWKQWDIAGKTVQLKGKTLAILGYGAIGKMLGRKCRSLGLEITALRRTLRKERVTKSGIRILPAESLDHLLTNADFLAVTCPLTPGTRGLIGERELALLKPSGIVINISRGAVIDEQALIRSLRTKQIAGAALDVFTHEPLEPASELFTLPNVLLSPHISGNFPEYQEAVVRQFANNLGRFLAGKPLINKVGKKRQY